MFGVSIPAILPSESVVESRSLLTRRLMFSECFLESSSTTTMETLPSPNLNDEQRVELEESRARIEV